MSRPFLIGVTGNIACGKTAVMHVLAELGATVIDGDLVYRELTGPESPLVRKLASAFGQQIANPDGSLDRLALGKIVFSDPEALKNLDSLTHPVIVEEVERRIAVATTPVVATDGIKLLESGLGDRCDQIWVVTCEVHRQRERLMTRNVLTHEEANRRIASQSPASEKVARADVVIENNSSLAELQEQVQAAWIETAGLAANRGYFLGGYET